MATPLPGPGALPTDDSIEELYDDAPCGFVSTSADGTVVRLNRTFTAWADREAEEIVGRLSFARLLTPGSRLVWLTHHVPQLERAGRLGAVVLDLDLGPRGTMPVLVSANLVERADLPRPLVRLTVVDARERRAFEAQLLSARRAAERAQWRIGGLQQVTETAASAASVATLLADVAAATTRGFTATGASVWTPEGPAGELRLAASYDLPSDPLLLGGGGEPACSAQLAWETGRTVHWRDHDPVTDPRLVAEVTAADSAGVVAVPLTYDDSRLGVVVLYLPEELVLDAEDLHTVEMTGTVVGQAVARTRMQEDLRHRAHHDPLTGFANRSLLEGRLRGIVERTGTTEGAVPTALLFIDLDDFKAVNDTHGHDVGDRLLVACARRISGVVREGDVVARTGGDEFVVLCEHTDAATAEQVAARIRAAVARTITVDHLELHVGASVGVATSGALRDWTDVQALMTAADTAMYGAKRLRKEASGPTD